MSVSDLPHLNASLNLLATLLLVSGYVLIKQKKEAAHKWTMIGCFAVSCLFLISYVIYHFNHPSKPFPRSDYSTIASVGYYVLLASHVILAALVPFLSVATIVLGLLDKRVAHRKLAKWTFPIWLYVSITGVLVYLMLYWWFVPLTAEAQL